MRLQRVREAGMQGHLCQPATLTHDHGAQPESESVHLKTIKRFQKLNFAFKKEWWYEMCKLVWDPSLSSFNHPGRKIHFQFIHSSLMWTGAVIYYWELMNAYHKWLSHLIPLTSTVQTLTTHSTMLIKVKSTFTGYSETIGGVFLFLF